MKKLYLFNSLTQKNDEIKLDNPMTIYICGPTVYDDAHIGHARNYMTFDIMKNIITKYYGHSVNLIMNITDIDDKIINVSGNKFREHAIKYETRFFEDMDKLNIARPDMVMRVSDHMTDIIEYITKMDKYIYLLDDYPDGTKNMSVYFDIIKYESDGHKYNKFKDFQNDNVCVLGKKDKRDFVLWKKSKKNEPHWESPWGLGRPGWHIECTTLIEHIVYKIDIHGGGEDLKFPHHENEIAQAEAHNNTNNWISHFAHIGHLHIDGKKMSKSLKNFITIREVLTKYSCRQLRLLFLRHQWNKPMEYTENEFESIKAYEKKIIEFMANVKTKKSDNHNDNSIILMKYVSFDTDVYNAISNNLQLNKVLDHIHELIGYLNKHIDDIDYELLLSGQRRIMHILNIFGLDFETNETDNSNVFINYIVELRESIRQMAINTKSNDLFNITDKIRKDMQIKGITIQDKKDSLKWFRHTII